MRRLSQLVSSLRGRRLSAQRARAQDTSGLRDIPVDFRMLTENSNDIICRIDEHNMPLYVSPSVQRILGWTAEEMLLGGPNFIHPDDEAMVAQTNQLLISGEREEAKLSLRLMNRQGQPIWVEANARRVDHPREGPSVVIVMRDISERRRLEDELRAQAMTDGLTGLANRRAFDQALDLEWKRTLRAGGRMSLLMLDVDQFKSFNDLYGHQAGDDCLRIIASTIKRIVRRPGDVAARYGGEEIAVILPETGAEGAASVAETLRAEIEALGVHHAGSDQDVRAVTVSIGVATAFARSGARTQMPAGLLLAADGALYKAKQSGRNRVVSTVLLTAAEGVSGEPS